MSSKTIFGSNLAGRHGKGAARFARQNQGAVYGQGQGFRARFRSSVAHSIVRRVRASWVSDLAAFGVIARRVRRQLRGRDTCRLLPSSLSIDLWVG